MPDSTSASAGAPSAPADVFSPALIEARARDHWTRTDAYRVDESATTRDGKPRPKFYACSMLPYPSGKLHMGHVRNYAINDVMARYMRMRGHNVLMPMGWDAFGLPAENAAIANNVPPAEWTYANIADMKAQMAPIGLSIDWSRELATCKPDYYKWNQWLFLKMLEKGIAYRRTQAVNWDPIDQTVLANEQVIDGRGWRSGALIERREIPGYYLGITQYADELLTSLDTLDGWPERVRAMQRNWIGRSVGANVSFPYSIAGTSGELRVFTTRADTLMGVTFVAVAAEHPLATLAARDNPAIAAFIAQCKLGGVSEAELATAEKLGVATGFSVQHPLTGESIPVWVGNYVLMTYGEGAVMGVPAHDERDFAFARKYRLPIKQVIAIDGERFDDTEWREWYGDKTRGHCVRSGRYDGMSSSAAIEAIVDDLAAKALGERKTTWRLRDWGISRQRYWGTPIPLIHCETCGVVPVPLADLPVVLPEHLVPDGSGNPLNKDAAFLNVKCPTCGAAAKRETDTMDTFVDSAWYFMRYCSPGADSMIDARAKYWMPMDQYIGGIEHAVLHLLYARFWTRAMRDLGLVDYSEPFTRLFTQGMILNESFYREDGDGRKHWFYPSEVEVELDERGKPLSARLRADGQPVVLGGIEKMAKSRNNVVEPRDVIARYGADTARLFSMFAGPPEQSAPWSDSGVEGSFRFLRRLWAFATRHQALLAQSKSLDAARLSPAAKDLRREIHATLEQISHDYDRMQYNTVVSGAMKMLNALEAAPADGAANDAIAEGFGILLRVLYPVTPHLGWVLWNDLGYAARLGVDILDAEWPAADPAALVRDRISLVVQVNGKVRGNIEVAADTHEATIVELALADADVARFIEGKPLKFSKVVKGKLVSLAV
ncbi:leucine--tRNA ligase [soil metagenome]